MSADGESQQISLSKRCQPLLCILLLDSRAALPALPTSSFFRKTGSAWQRLAARGSPWQSFPPRPRSGLKPHANLSPMRSTQFIAARPPLSRKYFASTCALTAPPCASLQVASAPPAKSPKPHRILLPWPKIFSRSSSSAGRTSTFTFDPSRALAFQRSNARTSQRFNPSTL
jgi:hypothetical protein